MAENGGLISRGGAPIFSPKVQNTYSKGFGDLWTENRGAPKIRKPTTMDPTPHSWPSLKYTSKSNSYCIALQMYIAVHLQSVLQVFVFLWTLRSWKDSASPFSFALWYISRLHRSAVLLPCLHVAVLMANYLGFGVTGKFMTE